MNQQVHNPNGLEGQPMQAQPDGGGNGGEKTKAKRSIKNFLLQPLLQVKLGLYCILLAILFSTGIGAIMYFNFADLIDSILLLTDAESDVRDVLMEYWRDAQTWIYMCMASYIFLTVVVSVLYTHKLVGPTIAFRRHVRNLCEGQYNTRTFLRKGDAFSEVADELNRLSEVLEQQNMSKPVSE